MTLQAPKMNVILVQPLFRVSSLSFLVSEEMNPGFVTEVRPAMLAVMRPLTPYFQEQFTFSRGFPFSLTD